MNKYQSEDYFSVIEKRTGKKLVDCGDEMDAIAIVSFDPQNRTYIRNKFLMSPVVDVEIQKSLPTTNVTISDVKENGCAPRKEQLLNAGPLRLNEDKRVPVNTK